MPDDAQHSTDPGSFTPRTTQFARLGMLLLLGGVLSAGVTTLAYFNSPLWNRIGLAPPQPIPFSHRHHAGELRLDCRFCHATVESAAAAGMPSTDTCLTCHSQLFARQAMFAPLRRSAAASQPLAWSRVTNLPDHVFFDHSIHIARGLACAACHGDVASMALTAKGRALTMRECLDCHRRVSGANPGLRDAAVLTSCSTCHH